MPATETKRTGQHYSDHEVALICLYRKSPEAAKRLAELCERTESAIDWVWAWRDREEKFQDRSRNSIVRQVQKAKEVLGEQFGSLEA